MSVARTRAILSTNSHEFVTTSWYSAHIARPPACEMIHEESDHRPVWGLARGAAPVTVPLKSGADALGVHVRTIEGHTVVGLYDQPTVLLELVMRHVPASGKSRGGDDAVFASFMKVADEAYRAHFMLQGLNVHFTRKQFESVNWMFFGVLPLRRIGTIFLDGALEQDVLSDARRFLSDEAAYNKFGRPFKRVYCLHGPPGTGKTSLVMAIASELGRPLAIFNTDSLRDDTFIELLTSRPADAVLMFEDVDSLFRMREMKAGGGGMTFSTMLNALDGVLHPRGSLIFLTTNHLDKLDAAIRRPGRVDRLIEVGYMTPSSATAMWRTAFPQHAVPPALLAPKARLVPAQLSELLFQNRDKNAATVAALVGRMTT